MEKPNLQQILKEKPKMMFRFEPKQEGTENYDLYIYDNITAYGKFDWSTWDYLESETSAEFFKKKLAEIPESGTINLYINSNGGDVQEALGIYNQLKRHPATVNGVVDGNAYSAAFLILMACDHKSMNIGTSALLHNMLMSCYGNAKQLRKYADDLDKLMESNRQIFLEGCKNSLTEEQLIEMMDEETFLTPDECLEYGFIDEVIKDAESEEDPEELEDLEEDPNDLQQILRGMGNMQLKQQAEERKRFLEELDELDKLTLKKEETFLENLRKRRDV